MSLRHLLATALLAALPAAPALAADYDPPIFVDEAPEYVPVEVGSGWYLRGDITYNHDHPFSNSSLGNTGAGGPLDFGPVYSESHTALGATVGMGYHFNDYFRVEANLGFFSSNDQRRTHSTIFVNPAPLAPTVLSNATATVENEAWTGIVNGYVDLGTYVGFTPYVGAGVGLAYSKRDYRYVETFTAAGVPPAVVTDAKNQFSLAYTLNAGVAYQMTKNLSLDVGYQYFSAPDLEYSVITGPGTYANRSGIDAHQVKVGLRYDLW